MRLLVLLFSCIFPVFCGCQQEKTLPPLKFDLKKAYQCKQDSDCILTCENLTTCCNQPCMCSRTYNRKFYKQHYKRIRSWYLKKQQCKSMRCPDKKKCPKKLSYKVLTQCYHGRCRARITHKNMKFDWRYFHRNHGHKRHPHKGHKHKAHRHSKTAPVPRNRSRVRNTTIPMSLPPKRRTKPSVRKHDKHHDHAHH